jgi:phage terminase large subunit-like protein
MAKDPVNHVLITTGSTYENKSNLAAPFMRQITQYEGTNLGRQEIYAELIDIEESGIVKRGWFKKWPATKTLPYFEFIIQSYDTAFTDKHENDPTACSVWGVFRPEPEEPYGIMLLDAWAEHLTYPDLRDKVIAEFQSTYGDTRTKADIVLMEEKGSGISLIPFLSLDTLWASIA